MKKHSICKTCTTALALLVVAATTACTQTDPASTPVAVPTPTTIMITQPPMSTPEVIVPESDNVFALTAPEKTMYDAYVANTDPTVLKDVPAISVAKIFIQCTLDNNIHAEYTLFAPEDTPDTEEEYIKKVTIDVEPIPLDQRPLYANAFFGILDKGEFVETPPNKGTINFMTSENQEAAFSMLKDKDGVWRIAYDYLGLQ